MTSKRNSTDDFERKENDAIEQEVFYHTANRSKPVTPPVAFKFPHPSSSPTQGSNNNSPAYRHQNPLSITDSKTSPRQDAIPAPNTQLTPAPLSPHFQDTPFSTPGLESSTETPKSSDLDVLFPPARLLARSMSDPELSKAEDTASEHSPVSDSKTSSRKHHFRRNRRRSESVGEKPAKPHKKGIRASLPDPNIEEMVTLSYKKKRRKSEPAISFHPKPPADGTSNSADAHKPEPEKQSSFFTKIKRTLISSHMEEALAHIELLFDRFFNDVPYNKIDIMFGLMLLNDYYKNTAMRTGAVVQNLHYVEEVRYYMRFASACYGWKFMYGILLRKPTGFLASITDGNQANSRALCEHTGIAAKDLISAKWTSSLYDSGHFMAAVHERKTLVVAFRGTFHLRDALVDLVATNSVFQDGSAHMGMLRIAKIKLLMLGAPIVEFMEKHPDYSVVVVGHSLGAGVGSLFTLMFHDEYPKIPIHCYAYGPPCVVSADIALDPRTLSLIDSIVFGDDIVPRLCFASMADLKSVVVQLLSQSNNTVQRVFQWATAGSAVSTGGVVDRVAKILRCAPKLVVKESDRKHGEMSMFPPGRVFHMFRRSEDDKPVQKSDGVAASYPNNTPDANQSLSNAEATLDPNPNPALHQTRGETAVPIEKSNNPHVQEPEAPQPVAQVPVGITNKMEDPIVPAATPALLHDPKLDEQKPVSVAVTPAIPSHVQDAVQTHSVTADAADVSSLKLNDPPKSVELDKRSPFQSPLPAKRAAKTKTPASPKTTTPSAPRKSFMDNFKFFGSTKPPKSPEVTPAGAPKVENVPIPNTASERAETLDSEKKSSKHKEEEFLLEASNATLFHEIIVSATMFRDHMPNRYEVALDSCLLYMQELASQTEAKQAAVQADPKLSADAPKNV